MQEIFERVQFDGADNIAPKLYKRVYHAGGKQRIKYSALFTDWQGIRRKIALGGDYKSAIRKIYDLDRQNSHEIDFDEQKQKRQAREMTFSKFVSQCPESMNISPWHLPHLAAFFGNKPIAQICDQDVLDYREKRAAEKIIKHGEASTKLVSATNINKEVSTLRKYLKQARVKGYEHKVTKFEMTTEAPRNRVLSAEEYSALLKHCPAWLRRAVQFSWETSLSRSDLFNLTWNEIDTEGSIIELKDGRAKTARRKSSRSTRTALRR